MNLYFGLWLIVAATEASLYAITDRFITRSKWFRLTTGMVLVAAIIVADVLMATRLWPVWFGALILTPYRLINLTRFMRFRLHPAKLGSLTLQAHRWLTGTQLVFVLLLQWLKSIGFDWAFGLLASVQLLIALVLLRASIRTWQHARPQMLEKHFTDKELPSLSVLIPARDETDALQTCLHSILTNDYPKMEVLVLDDCSVSKRTPEIIRSFAQEGVRFIAGKTPPHDWVAKNYGYEQLRAEASGELLLFCGADTTMEPQTIRALVETLLIREKAMLSVLPTRPAHSPSMALLQSMRYYWELCLPRRFFKRPPVLSTCWLIKRATLESFGGFGGVAQSVSPEAHFARQAVVSDSYTFVRSDGTLQVHTHKSLDEQFDTTVRLRYPQLHRRIELVAAATLFEGIFFVLPFFGLAASMFMPHRLAYLAVWGLTIAVVETMYYLIAVQTRLHHAWYAFIAAPVAFLLDIVMLHISMARYEFGTVNWKGRNVCVPVMRVESNLPKNG